ncbi:hypothetical protein BBP40_008843 [Aspergillus hancockii]|nr:hypothetical protein BBP40_008843 [Aspergillus hancockii]
MAGSDLLSDTSSAFLDLGKKTPVDPRELPCCHEHTSPRSGFTALWHAPRVSASQKSRRLTVEMHRVELALFHMNLQLSFAYRVKASALSGVGCQNLGQEWMKNLVLRNLKQSFLKHNPERVFPKAFLFAPDL